MFGELSRPFGWHRGNLAHAPSSLTRLLNSGILQRTFGGRKQPHGVVFLVLVRICVFSTLMGSTLSVYACGRAVSIVSERGVIVEIGRVGSMPLGPRALVMHCRAVVGEMREFQPQ